MRPAYPKLIYFFVVFFISFSIYFTNFIISDMQDSTEECYLYCRPSRIAILTAKDEGDPFAEAQLTDE